MPTVLKTGLEVTISCSEGEEGQVYAGLLPFEVKEVALENLPPTQILMNVGNPSGVQSGCHSNDGGVDQLEFITNNIQVHPGPDSL